MSERQKISDWNNFKTIHLTSDSAKTNFSSRRKLNTLQCSSLQSEQISFPTLKVLYLSFYRNAHSTLYTKVISVLNSYPSRHLCLCCLLTRLYRTKGNQLILSTERRKGMKEHENKNEVEYLSKRKHARQSKIDDIKSNTENRTGEG